MLKKLQTPLIIIGLVLVLVLFFQVKGCITARNEARISRLEGELAAAEKQAEKIKKENIQAIGEMWKEIQRQKAEIATKNKAIRELVEQDEEIIPTEIIDAPGEGEDWERVAGVNAQAARDWREKYFKAQEVITELGVPIEVGRDPEGKMLYRYPVDSVTYKLHQQYLLSEERAKKFKENWDLAENLNRISKEVIRKKDKKIARLKVGKTLERIILTPLAVFGGLKLFGVIK